MKKYRVKIEANRVIGPFDVNGLKELVQNNKINKKSTAQLFPVGEWVEINELLPELFKSTDNKIEMTIEVKNQEAVIVPEMKEFKAATNPVKIEIDYEELEKKFESKTQIAKKSELVPDKAIGIKQDKIFDLEKTMVNARFDNIPFAVEEKIEQPENFAPKEREIEVRDENELKTEVINIKEILPSLRAESIRSERNLDSFEKLEIEKLRVEKNKIEQALEEKKVNENEKIDSAASKKSGGKKMTPIIALVFMGMIYLFLFDETNTVKKASDVIYPQIEFPITKEYENKDSSQKLYEAAVIELKKDNYESKINASILLKKSLEESFSGNDKALGLLLRSYSELLEHVNEGQEPAKSIVKLYEISSSKIYNDENIALGISKIFERYGKVEAGIKILRNYLETEKNKKVTIGFFVQLADLNMRNNDILETKRAIEQLQKAPSLGVDAVVVMAKYDILNEKYDDALKLIETKLKEHPGDIRLILLQLQVYFDQQNFDAFIKVLDKISPQMLQKSPLYSAKYLEYKGRDVLLKKGKAAVASEFFNKSLALHESSYLRNELAMLSVEGNTTTKKIISDSKVKVLLSKAEEAKQKGNWNQAFSYALDAIDAGDSYLTPKIYLSRLQLERGYFDSAINTLKNVKLNSLAAAPAMFAYGNALIESRRLEDAKQMLNDHSMDPLSATSQYASILGRYYLKASNLPLAAKWITESINRNPFNDEEFYLLAKIYLKMNKIDMSKKMLTKAISLEPTNPDYRILYSSILYEIGGSDGMSGSDIAIGYLRGLLKDFPDNNSILTNIATYYFKSGLIKEYEDLKIKIIKLNKQDFSFYEFLYEAARKENNKADMVKYAKELSIIKPGDMDYRVLLAGLFISEGKLDDAKKELQEIISRIPKYPTVYSTLSKINLIEKNLEEALRNAYKEIENVPRSELSYSNLANIYIERGEYGKAVMNLEKAISLNSKSVEVLMTLGRLKRQQRQPDESREYLEKALKENINNGELHREMGYTLVALGQKSTAVDEFQIYLKLEPSARDRSEIEHLIKQIK